ncbi:MAG: DUF927 domain-containing protein [Bryobacteraceae bacterium]
MSLRTQGTPWTPREVQRFIDERCPGMKRQHGSDEVRGPCPVHGGKDPNFSINPKTGLAQCFSQCSRGWNLIALEAELSGASLKDAFKAVARIVGRQSTNGTAQATGKRIFTYTDSMRKPLRDVVRTDTEQGKRINQRAHDNTGGFRNNVKGVPDVLYRLPEVLEAQQVFIVEGEPKVELLRRWGRTATCNSGGAGKFTSEHADVLKGKSLVILPDNDEPGRKHAELVRALCQGKAEEILTVELPGLGPKGDIVDWARAGNTKETLLALVDDTRKTPQPQTPNTEPAPRTCESEFRSDEKGLYLVPKDRTKEPQWIAPPLTVIARTRDFNGDGAGVLIEFTTWEGRRKQRIIPLKTLMGEGREGLEALLDAGYQPKRGRSCFDRVKDYIYSTNPSNWVRITARTGMHGSSFVFPDRTIGAQDTEQVLFYSEEPVTHRYHTAGSVTDWREGIGLLCRGNTRLVLAVSAAFAGPLLPLLKAQSAGLHFRALSSKGKTTALLVAGSVWGGDAQTGFLDTWKSTAAGLELRASLHNHSLLTLDEIGLASPDEVSEAIYALCNGTGKIRATRTLTARASSQFTLMFLSSGERGLSEYLRAAGRVMKGGQDVRLIEIPADSESGQGLFEKVPPEFENPATFANALKERARRYYGTPIEAYLHLVTSNIDAVTQQVQNRRKVFVQKNVTKDDSGEVWRVAETFGLIAAAGELATQLGITGWKPGEAQCAAEVCFRSWIDERGGTGARDIEQGIRAVRAFIGKHGGSRFQKVGHQEPERIVNRAGFKEAKGNAHTYYILSDVWKDEVCVGFESKEVAKAMAARGFLARERGRHLSIRKTMPELGLVRVYAVQPAFFGDELNEDNDPHDGESEPESQGITV